MSSLLSETPWAHRKRVPTKVAAEYCDLSPSTLNKLRIYGGGPAYVKIGRRVLYDLEELDRWLDSHRRASTSDLGATPCAEQGRPGER